MSSGRFSCAGKRYFGSAFAKSRAPKIGSLMWAPGLVDEAAAFESPFETITPVGTGCSDAAGGSTSIRRHSGVARIAKLLDRRRCSSERRLTSAKNVAYPD